MLGPFTDVRAGVVRRRYQQDVGGAELPVPAEANAGDLCQLTIEELVGLDVSGMLVRAKRLSYADRAGLR